MAAPKMLLAREELRAARDARYRMNVEFAITQTRRIVVLVLLATAMTTDAKGLACEVGPAWGVRDELIGSCADPPSAAAGRTDLSP